MDYLWGTCLVLAGASFCYNKMEKNDGKEACRLKKKKKSQIGFRAWRRA